MWRNHRHAGRGAAGSRRRRLSLIPRRRRTSSCARSATGLADVQYAEVHEVFVRSPGVTNANFAVQVPGPPPGAPPAGLEVVEMVDAQGPVPVLADSGGGRPWRAQRPVTYPVTITYKARMWPPGTRTNPSPMLRTAEGAVSGQGSGILVVPSDGVNYAAHFRWDLSDLAPGSITTSGLTDENDVRAPIQTLTQNFFMAGPLHRYPATGDRDGFAAYWHGTTRWDGPRDMAWVASMYEYMRKTWGETTPRRYRVMGRMLPPPAYGGTATGNQFMFNALAAPYDTSDIGPLLLLAHETGHLFVRGLQNPGGGGPSNNWFSEGLNEYYAITLALRSGLASPDLVLQEMNMQTRNYYTNPRKNMPADSVAMNNPLTDVMAQNISYERGTLFWAEMDARIRAASKGKRNLDNVMVPLDDARADARRRRHGRRSPSETRRTTGLVYSGRAGRLARERGRSVGATVVRFSDRSRKEHRSDAERVRTVLRASAGEDARSLSGIECGSPGGRRLAAGSRHRCLSLGARHVGSG